MSRQEGANRTAKEKSTKPRRSPNIKQIGSRFKKNMTYRMCETSAEGDGDTCKPNAGSHNDILNKLLHRFSGLHRQPVTTHQDLVHCSDSGLRKSDGAPAHARSRRKHRLTQTAPRARRPPGAPRAPPRDPQAPPPGAPKQGPASKQGSLFRHEGSF